MYSGVEVGYGRGDGVLSLKWVESGDNLFPISEFFSRLKWRALVHGEWHFSPGHACWMSLH